MAGLMAKRKVDEDSNEREVANAYQGVVPDHLATLRGTRDRVLWLQVCLQFAVPVALGLWAFFGDLRLTVVSDLLTAFSVLAGFLFALVIFVFQLRLSMSRDPRVQSHVRLPNLIDELFANVLYAVAASFVLIAVAAVAAATTPVGKHGLSLGTYPILSALVVALTVHLLAVIAMCIKRTRRAYIELRS